MGKVTPVGGGVPHPRGPHGHMDGGLGSGRWRPGKAEGGAQVEEGAGGRATA